MSNAHRALGACLFAALIAPGAAYAADAAARTGRLTTEVNAAEARGVAATTTPAVVTPAPAAVVTPAAPAVAGLVVGGSETSLRVGTEVPLRMLTELTTNGKLLKVGDRFNLEVADPISVAGQIVIPVGSRAVGEVTRVRNKGMWGKSGGIDARIMYVTANGRSIRASGTVTDKGTTGTAGVVGAAVLIPIAGFFVTGTSAKIPAGTIVRAFIDEDVPVAFAAGSGSVPMVVQAAPALAPAPPTLTPAVTPISAPPR